MSARAASECFSLPLRLGQAEMENQEETTSDQFAIWKKEAKCLIWSLYKDLVAQGCNSTNKTFSWLNANIAIKQI